MVAVLKVYPVTMDLSGNLDPYSCLDSHRTSETIPVDPCQSPLAATRDQGPKKATLPSDLMLNHPSEPPLKIQMDDLNAELLRLIRVSVKFCV